MYQEDIDLPELLYHYTTLIGCEGILKSKALWMVNHKDQKDKQEVISHDKLIESYLEGNDSLSLKNPLHILFPRLKLISSINDNSIDEKNCGVYLTCFSSSPNNKKLWEGFADEFKGVVICINRERAKISPLNGNKTINAFTQNTLDIVGMSSCVKVDYLKKEVIHEQIKKYINEYNSACSVGLGIEEIDLLNKNTLLNQIYHRTYTLKLDTYSNEKEYRLYVEYSLNTYQRLGTPQINPSGSKILNFPLPYDCIEKIFVSEDKFPELVQILDSLNLPDSLISKYDRNLLETD